MPTQGSTVIRADSRFELATVANSSRNKQLPTVEQSADGGQLIIHETWMKKGLNYESLDVPPGRRMSGLSWVKQEMAWPWSRCMLAV